MKTISMKIDSRDEKGTNKVKKLRKENIVPGVIYSREDETKHVKVNLGEFQRVFRQAGTSSMINLELDGEKVPVIIKEVQNNHLGNKVLHIDFQRLRMDEKIKLNVPINLINRDSIKLQPSVLMQMLDEIEIECLPGSIPQTADVDVENMDFTEPITVKDLDIFSIEGITVFRDEDEVVCTLVEPSEEEVEETDEDELLETEETEEVEETEE